MSGKSLKTSLVALAALAVSLLAVGCDDQTPEQPTFYTVAYAIGEGATGTAPAGGSYEAGATFSVAAADGITKAGYTFGGWNDGTTTYQAGATYTMPAAAVTFTAVWTEDGDDPTTYSVTYNIGDGASGTAPAGGSYEAGATFSVAAADGITKAGYTFGGWNDGTTTYQAGATYTMPAAAVTFTAVWTEDGDDPTTYCVTYNIGDGASGTAPAGGSYEAGATFSVAAADGITKAGYTFGGWNDGTTTYQAGATYTMPAAAVTFTAVWTEDGDDPQPIFTTPVSAVIMHDGQITEGQLILMPDRSGYINISNKSSGITIVESYFSYTVADGTFTITSAPESRLTVPVSGTVVGNRVSITLENTSSAGAKISYLFQSDVYELAVDRTFGNPAVEKFYLPQGYACDLTEIADERPGYELTGFTVNNVDKTVDEGEEFAMPAANVSVVCKWQEIQAVNYTVTYTAGGGVGEDYVDTATSTSYRLKYNTVTGFTRNGYRFAGWLVNGQEKNTGDTITLTGDTQITARWNKVYTVTYANVDMAGVNTAPDYNPSDPDYSEFTSNTYWLPYEFRPSMSNFLFFNRDGYTLKGWTSSADTDTEKEGTIYVPGSKYVLTQNTTFTAVWVTPSTLLADRAGTYVSSSGMTADGRRFVKVIVAERSIKMIEDDNTESSITNIQIDESTVTGQLGTYAVTVEFGQDKIGITLKLGNNTFTGEFVPYVPPVVTMDRYFGYYEGEASFRSNDYVTAKVADGTVSFSESYAFDYPDDYSVTVTEENGNVTAVFKYAVIYRGTVVFVSDTSFTVKVEKMKRDDTTVVDSVVLQPTTFTKASAHTVSFELGTYTGTASAPADKTVIGNRTVTAPTPPAYEGYRFSGWFKGNAATPFDFGTVISEDIVLTAKWERITEVTVTFDVGTGVTDVTPPAAQTVPYNTAVTQPAALTRDGYRFDGWYESATATAPFDFGTAIKDNKTLYARWSKAYTVTFTKNAGAVGEDPAQVTIYRNEELTYPACPYTKDGVSFLGWRNQNSPKLYQPGDKFTYTFQMNATVTAVFGTVYANKDAQTGGVVTVRDDSTSQVWYYTGDGYYDYNEFVDFVKDDGNDDILCLFTSFVSTWIELNADKTYTVLDDLKGYVFTAADGTALTFDGKGGAKLGSATATYTVKQGYYGAEGFVLTFAADNVYDITFEVYDENYMPVLNTDITVGGVTYTFGVKYTVTYSVGEGVQGAVPAAVTAWSDTQITLDGGSGLTKEGFTFVGWQAGGAGAVLKGSYMVTASVTLVAAWTENAVVGGNTLKDYKAKYGYASFADSGNASSDGYLAISTSLGEYQIWQIEVITKMSAGTMCYQISFEYCVDYKAKTKNAGMILYVAGTSTSDKLTDDNMDATSATFEFKVSGNAVTLVFGEKDGAKTVTLSYGTNSVTWTAAA